MPEPGDHYQVVFKATPPNPPQDFIDELSDEARGKGFQFGADEATIDLIRGAGTRGYSKGWRHAIGHMREELEPAVVVMLKGFREDLAKHMRELATRQTDSTLIAVVNACADAVETYPILNEEQS